MLRVVVVGGGPAGCLSAINLASKAEIILVEQKKRVGFPTQCAGLISEDCYFKLKKYGIKKIKIKKINGAFFFSPSGKYLEAKGRSKGVLVERKLLDIELLLKASEESTIKLGERFVGVKNVKSLLKGIKNEQIKFDYIIGCDGPNSTVAKTFGFKKPDMFYAVQAEFKFDPISNDMVEIYFGKKYSDSFFSYSIPVDEFAKIGTISRTKPFFYFKKLIEKHPSVSKRVKKRKMIEFSVGCIPIGLVDFVRGNVALVGDSAAMVKPYTGGGLYYHLVASEILGKSFPDLKRFKKEYIKKLGKEYKIGMFLHRLYSVFDDNDYDEIITKIKSHDLLDLHMDKPSTLIRRSFTFSKCLRLNVFLKILKCLLTSKQVLKV